jgi:hypothetical protein
MGCDGTCDFCKEYKVYKKLESLQGDNRYRDDEYLQGIVQETIDMMNMALMKREDLAYDAYLKPCKHCGKRQSDVPL